MAASDTSVLPEILSGDSLALSAAARLLPAHRGPGRASASTVWRWIRTGTRTLDGQVVRLEAARVGGRWLTSRAALARFAAALTEAAETDPTPTTPPARPPAASRRAAEQFNERLKRRGA